MAKRALFVGMALAIVGACSLPSTDEFAKPVGAEAGSPVDAHTPSTSLEAGADADSGPHFETDDDGGDAGFVDLLQAADSTYDESDKCGNDSGSFQATLTPSTVAHSGSGACELCRTGSSQGNAYTMDIQIRNTHPRAGQQFMALAWVRRPPGDTDQTTISISLRTHNGDFNAVDEADSPPVALTDDYQLIQTTLDVTQNTSNMDLFVSNDTTDGVKHPCFLLDDVFAWQSK